MPALVRRYIRHLEKPRQYAHAALDRQRPIAAPYDVFTLLAEAPQLRPAVHLAPDSHAAPCPARPLNRVRQCRQLPPVHKQRAYRAGLAGFARCRHDFMKKRSPCPLRQCVAAEIWIGIPLLAEAGIFIPRASRFLAHGHATAGIGWVADDGGQLSAFQLPQLYQSIPLNGCPSVRQHVRQLARIHPRPPSALAAPG